MRILIAFGTRPEIIKLGPVYRALRQHPGVQVDVFWSGRHIELATGLLDLFDIAVTHNGSAGMSEPGLAGKFRLMAQQIEHILRATQYESIVVQGDTATAALPLGANDQTRKDWSRPRDVGEEREPILAHSS